MFLPYRTDAPIYHWPYATVGLIVVNILVFFWTVLSPSPELDFDQLQGNFQIEVQGEGDDAVEVLVDQNGQVVDVDQLGARAFTQQGIGRWMLVYGDGLHPLQWVTSNFIHADLGHVLGNMLFLWVFGLVVEGKLGNLPFLVLYFGLGIVECAIEQVLMLGMDFGASCGASSIIYGLLAMSLVWAPKNDVSILYFFTFFWSGSFDISILVLGGIYIGWDFILAFGQGMRPSTELLHSLGAILGLAVGFVMLKCNWVDCEGWDILSVMAGTHGSPRKSEREKAGIKIKAKRRKKRTGSTLQSGSLETSSDLDPIQAANRLSQYLDEHNLDAATNHFRSTLAQLPHWDVPLYLMRELMKRLHEEKRWAQSVPVMRHFIASNPDPSPAVRLKLAQILLEAMNQVEEAQLVLQSIPEEGLAENLATLRRKLLAKTRQVRESEDSYGLA